ncbi:ABC-type nitrate/sulfonate/bicarbonate transport system permease component [Murinocardiopsis flavida]|uniref:ABC-type nitrate/sulfonate/bicarbonate transport system permease component n=1 Tax=Murinocardiopsis flavida TaxID=645275 RepID=A0A2P8DNT6_9ACTN|nr:ABC transporter permease [Murinocardiopsis flavida]PSK98880.1 ABC-type nitrate/sulfonate/bicarbonate transport system permease component [Murinocardiopsis flavida]
MTAAPAARTSDARTSGAAPAAAHPALLGTAGALVFLALWEAAPRTGLVDARALPPLSAVVPELVDRASGAAYWIAVGDTVAAAGLGLAIALAAALALGFAVGSVPVLRAYTASTVEFLRPIPSVALIPVAVLLYATDIRSTLLLVVYASFWQIYIQVLYGVADIDPVVEQTARSFRFGRAARVRHVIWPSALPYVLTGVRLGAAVALILAVTAQLVIGSPGLGKQIQAAQAGGAVPAVYALILTTGALGVLVNVGVRALERRVLRWHPAVRGEAPV